MNVLFTIDTEVHAITWDWKTDHLRRDLDRDIEGLVGTRSFGLNYLLDILNRCQLRACFMVESVFSVCPDVGIEPLREIVQRILKAGHEVNLHPHCEWLEHCPARGIPYRGYLQRCYTLEEQYSLISLASERLVECGAPRPRAFRAGGFGANHDSIVALAQAGFSFDSSFNVDYPDKCGLSQPPSFGAPHEVDQLLEMPIAAFRDYPGHWRPAQICACSAPELTHALDQAEELGWTHFVILCHTFEVLSGRRQGRLAVRNEVVETLEEVCSFLSANRSRFRTIGFDEIDTSSGSSDPPHLISEVICLIPHGE